MQEKTVSFNEIKTILQKEKKFIQICVSVCFLLGLIYSLTKPIQYTAEGVFKDKSKINNNMSSFAGLLSGSANQDNNTIAIMKSRTVREELARSLNLQAALKPDERDESYLKRILQNIRAEVNQFFYPLYLSLNEISPRLVITNIIYEREIPHKIDLRFTSEEDFEISDESQKKVGKLGEPFTFQDYTFTLNKVNASENLSGQTFAIQFHALSKVVKDISDHLTIQQDRSDKNLLNITFKDRNRNRAALAVNALMSTYKNYLKNEQNLVIAHQIQYLEKRQDEIGSKLKKSMESHVLKISEDIEHIGFPTMQLAMEFLTSSQNALQKKLLDIEFELKRLSHAQETQYVYYDSYSLPGDQAIINEMLTEMRKLKAESSSLNSNLQDFKPMKETPELDGIDLKTAGELFVSYTHKLNDIESQIMQNQFIVNKMEHEDFDLSSLGAVLRDETSREISSKASLLVMNLKDSNNRSIKEQERIKEELDLQKRFLKDHLENANQLLSLNESLMKYKVKSLQNVTLGAVKKQILSLENNLADYITNRIDNLKAEISVIEKHKLALMKQMSTLPSKWVSEKLMNLEMEANQRMVEEVSRLVETKNISSNLEIIQSNVIDQAKPPLHPVSPRPLLFALLGSLIGALFGTTYTLFRHLNRLT